MMQQNNSTLQRQMENKYPNDFFDVIGSGPYHILRTHRIIDFCHSCKRTHVVSSRNEIIGSGCTKELAWQSAAKHLELV